MVLPSPRRHFILLGLSKPCPQPRTPCQPPRASAPALVMLQQGMSPAPYIPALPGPWPKSCPWPVPRKVPNAWGWCCPMPPAALLQAGMVGWGLAAKPLPDRPDGTSCQPPGSRQLNLNPIFHLPRWRVAVTLNIAPPNNFSSPVPISLLSSQYALNQFYSTVFPPLTATDPTSLAYYLGHLCFCSIKHWARCAVICKLVQKWKTLKLQTERLVEGRTGEHKDSYTGQTSVCLVPNLASERDGERL